MRALPDGARVVKSRRPQLISVFDGLGSKVVPIREVTLRPFDEELDSPRLWEWLRRPHVAEWWGDAQQELQEVLASSPDTSAVIVADGVPVGHLFWQRLPPDEREAAGLSDLPDDLVDIDIMIGEPEMTGQGVGPTALGLLLARLRGDALVSFAAVGTSLSNGAAIRAFEKAGFRPFRDFEDREWGPCRYMVAELRPDEAGLRMEPRR